MLTGSRKLLFPLHIQKSALSNGYNFSCGTTNELVGRKEKVRKDEEAAAEEEQLKREQSRKRDAEFRLDKLRQARGVSSSSSSHRSESEPSSRLQSESKSNNHINLFEGIKIFNPVGGDKDDDDKRKGFKKMKKEATPKVIMPEDEKYRLGYGLVGKGVKLPWYRAKKPIEDESDDEFGVRKEEGNKSSSGKKTIEELREERLKRERREKGRERVLILEKQRRDGLVPRDRGYSTRYT
ncbi:hypothetical protein LguiB_001488 [Lonicera macranthoides]